MSEKIENFLRGFTSVFVLFPEHERETFEIYYDWDVSPEDVTREAWRGVGVQLLAAMESCSEEQTH